MDQFQIILQAIFEQAGITKGLNEIQKIAKNSPIELITKLESATVKNDIKQISGEFAKVINSIPGIELKVTDKNVESILSSMISQSSILNKQLEITSQKINYLKDTKSIDLKLSGIEKEYQKLESLGLITNTLKSDFEKLRNVKENFDSS